MIEPAENLMGNTEVTPGNTEATAPAPEPGIEATKTGISWAINKMKIKPGTSR